MAKLGAAVPAHVSLPAAHKAAADKVVAPAAHLVGDEAVAPHAHLVDSDGAGGALAQVTGVPVIVPTVPCQLARARTPRWRCAARHGWFQHGCAAGAGNFDKGRVQAGGAAAPVARFVTRVVATRQCLVALTSAHVVVLAGAALRAALVDAARQVGTTPAVAPGRAAALAAHCRLRVAARTRFLYPHTARGAIAIVTGQVTRVFAGAPLTTAD
mmetsp:Transcript_16090/g.50306  ORF Transcript_16090/g.50306 Transcript_16090/m.50306 type:complete len:213 (-) Transcript_16090:103-741(-)